MVGGCLAQFFGKPILDNAKASESWPTAEGTIVSSRVKEERDRDHEREHDRTTYEAEVVYTFAVDEQSYQADDIWFGQYGSGDRQAAQTLVDEYPAGATVPVYYSPDDPSQAVLQPGAFVSSYIVYGIGLLVLAIGILMAIAGSMKVFGRS